MEIACCNSEVQNNIETFSYNTLNNTGENIFETSILSSNLYDI